MNDGDWVDPAGAIAALRDRGHELVLSEGGPTLFTSLVAAGLVDELFLTVSPLLAGRSGVQRLSLADGAELLPDVRVAGDCSRSGGTGATCSCATRSRLLLVELERRRVDAVAMPGRRGAVGEHVPEMAAAVRAHHLGTDHPVA